MTSHLPPFFLVFRLHKTKRNQVTTRTFRTSGVVPPPHLSSFRTSGVVPGRRPPPSPARTPAGPPLSPTPMARPTMTHSSAFLLPSAPADAAATTYALIVLNQRLPRFAPLLWSRGAVTPLFRALYARALPRLPLTLCLWCFNEQRGCGCARTVAPTASSTACRSSSPTRTRPRSARGGSRDSQLRPLMSLLISYACPCSTGCSSCV
jgi:hypothetical protein